MKKNRLWLALFPALLFAILFYPSVSSARKIHNTDADTIVRGKTTFVRDTAIANKSALRLYDANSSNYVSLESPTTVTSNVEYVWPGTDGTSGYCLQTDGSGTLTWASCGSSGGGGGVTGTGTVNSVAYWNSATSLTGTSSLSWDPASTLLSIVGNLSANGSIDATNDITTLSDLGVGTASPAADIHVHNSTTGAVDADILVTTADDGRNNIGWSKSVV